jgi:transcriptional regulator with GAF, ATPase, and Fis domain/tetratricopeptide (TPR) repeat protein
MLRKEVTGGVAACVRGRTFIRHSMAAHTLSAHTPGHGFVELDDRLLAVGSAGVLLVVAPTAEIAEAAGAHVARRAEVKGLTFFHPRTRAGSPVFREVQAELGLSCCCDIVTCASEIAEVGATLVIPLPGLGTWDRAVLQELTRVIGARRALHSALAPAGSGLLLVLLSSDGDGYPAGTPADLEIEAFDMGEKMTAEARRRWFAAVAERACVDAGVDDLATLDSSFATLPLRVVDGPSFRPMQAIHAGTPVGQSLELRGGEALLASLELVGRVWPVHDLGAFGSDPAPFSWLSEAGAVRVARGFVSIDPSFRSKAEGLAAASSREAILKVAELLRTRFADDAWAKAHRAELLLRAEDHEGADLAFASAISHAKDPLARRELVARWSSLLLGIPGEPKLALAVKCAERALASGRAEEAYHWAELAATVGAAGEDPYVALLFGRANVATGDLVAATVAFERGQARATGDARAPMRLLFQAEQAEVAYLRGSLDEAKERASEVVRDSTEAPVQLEARNTLGKILLARAAWDEADRHFEEDAWLASSNGLPTCELRARSNRAIALLSRGLIDKARALFEAVLTEGERHGEVRACAFALDNLAVVASHQHQYVAALELWERAFKLRQELGDRTALTHILGNLALIRLKLGLWEHAEHAIAFGRRMLGPGTPVARSAYFALCAGRVALMRGRTMQARREVMSALPESRVAGNAKYLAEAERLMARIELDEGNLVRAREALDLARDSLTTEEGRAEMRILEATLARAQGDLDPELALSALALARLADNEELLIEAETLLSELYRAVGDFDLARRHFEQGLLLRDQVVSALPGDIRPAYLSRPDSLALDRAGALLREVPRDLPIRDLREPRDSSSPWVEGPPSAGRWGDGSPSVAPAPESVASSRAPQSMGPRTDAAARILVGADPSIRALLSAVKKVAAANCTVLIRGESGTGKELVAQAVHSASDRAGGPLVTVNCAALVETLLLSELFGHERGAFTGAASRRRGRFELAEGGTLFLDEIGDISARTQVALLRVLQERTFERVGGAAPIHVDVRILCATHRDLKSMVDRGEFRQDLYYRLRGVTLDVPPLRMRMGDLPIISTHLLARIATERDDVQKTLASDAIELLSRHRWPGNVRELENALRAASLFAEGAIITADDLILNVDELRLLSESRPSMPPGSGSMGGDFERERDLWPNGGNGPPSARGGSGRGDLDGGSDLAARATTEAYAQVRGGAASLSDIKRQIERDCIARALAETKGNITRAAVLLGMKRPRLSQLVKHYGLLAASSSEAS